MADFDSFIDALLAELTLKSNVLRLKLQSYGKWYDRSQILQFAGTSVIALLAATVALTSGYLVAATPGINTTDDLDPAINFTFTIAILVISSVIGFVMLVVKFRGWKKKSDDMGTVYKRSMDVMSDLPGTQQQLKAVRTSEEFDLLKTAFLAREFKFYMDTLRSINEYLSFESQTNHLPSFYDINIRNKQDQVAYHASLLEVLLQERETEQDMHDEIDALNGLP